MASTKAYLEFILEQLSALEGVTYRPMMGEYLLYLDGTLFGGIYDNRLLLKPVPSVLHTLETPRMEAPYPGAKPMLLAELSEDPAALTALVQSTAQALRRTKGKRG